MLSGGDYIIRPEGFTIPSDASMVHGITIERALNEGYPLFEVLQEFSNLIEHSGTLVAHNFAFDEKIIGAEFLGSGIHNVVVSKRRICTMQGTTNFCAISGPYGYKWPRLSEFHYKLFGSYFEEAHNAAVDITATAKCFWELRRLGKI